MSALALLILAGVLLAAGIALIVHWALRPRIGQDGLRDANPTPPPAIATSGPGLSPDTVAGPGRSL